MTNESKLAAAPQPVAPGAVDAQAGPSGAEPNGLRKTIADLAKVYDRIGPTECQYVAAELRHALAAAAPASVPGAPVAPKGWKLVPVEPTREMTDAGAMHTVMADEHEPYRARGAAIAAYSDMLAAAPVSDAAAQASQQPVADLECDRCGLPPGAHTPAHWCDNQSFSAAPAAATPPSVSGIGEAAEPAEWPREADPLTQAIQRLNSSTHNLTKDECIEVLREMRAAALLHTTPATPPLEAQPQGPAGSTGEGAEPLLGPDHTGMRVDYRGLLRQLQDHLTELGRRWYAGDVAVVDEILQLYCVERDARAALQATKEGGAA